MSLKLQNIYDFIYHFEEIYIFLHEKRPKGGRKKTYSHTSFILFFIAMFLRGVFRFKTMRRICLKEYAKYGFVQAPSRKTIRERFKKLPTIIEYFLPKIALFCYKKVCHNTFTIKCLFSDKSIFRAKGGIWHSKHIKKGIVPHSSIDSDASWAKSAYHNWRFGYALLIITNQNRFPVALRVDTATLNEAKALENLIKPLFSYIGIIVGDAAYKVYKIINTLRNKYNILLQVKSEIKDKNMEWYKNLIQTVQALILYQKRKSSVEPTFALIKELFKLNGENQLPFKGKKYVIPFLLICVFTVQIMAVYNFHNKNNLGYSFEFKALF